MNWDRTTPSIPILGSNEINNNPYTTEAEITTLYDDFLKGQKRLATLWRPVQISSTISFLRRFFSKCRERFSNAKDQSGITQNPKSDLDDVERPNQDRFMEIITNDFPLPSNIQVEVMDFSLNRCERARVPLGDTKLWEIKPDWAAVRWVHVPLGRSWFGTFCEDEVLTGGPRGFPFSNAGSPHFPYVATQTMSFWSKKAFLRQRSIVHNFSDPRSDLNKEISSQLLHRTWGCTKLANAARNYPGQRGRRPRSFWPFAFAQMPLDLEEVTNSDRQSDTAFGHKRRSDAIRGQILSRHPYYQNAHFVRSEIRLFHRSDGFVLSMGPPLGIQYLHRDWFAPSIAAGPREYPTNTWGSFVPQAYHHLSKTAQNWYQMDANWLITYLVTEATILPSSRLGGPGLNPEEAYFIILQQLKQRRRDEWDSPQAVDLVNDLVDLNDELHMWRTHLDAQIQVLTRLRKDSVALESYYQSIDNSETPVGAAQGPIAAADRAMKVIHKRQEQFDVIFLESSRVLEALFRLRTIQQNELATSADRTNKTIVIFTIVSLIFMPLTFLTSYFAILPVLEGDSSSNVAAVSSGQHQATTFWSIAAPLTIGIACFSVGAAFRRNLLHFARISLGLEIRATAMHEAEKMA